MMTLGESGLKDIFVLRETGECVFHQSYSKSEEKLKDDEMILSGFLSAIETFSSNVDNGTSLLETNNFRFVYHRSEEYLYVARTAKDLNPKEVARRLNSISSAFKPRLPQHWDGSVKVFQGIEDLVVEHFDSSLLNNYLEITGKESKNLEGFEEKIYSFLRFRGRSKLSTIVKLMKIPVNDAQEVTQKLLENNYLTTHDYT